jgi:hypothetical protein
LQELLEASCPFQFSLLYVLFSDSCAKGTVVPSATMGKFETSESSGSSAPWIPTMVAFSRELTQFRRCPPGSVARESFLSSVLGLLRTRVPVADNRRLLHGRYRTTVRPCVGCLIDYRIPQDRIVARLRRWHYMVFDVIVCKSGARMNQNRSSLRIREYSLRFQYAAPVCRGEPIETRLQDGYVAEPFRAAQVGTRHSRRSVCAPRR